MPNPTPPPATLPSVENVRRLLRRYRLKGIGSHIGVTQFRDNLTQVLDDAETLGLRYIGTASEPDQLFPAAERQTVDAHRRAAEAHNMFGAAARARGMRFYHHNHSSEFADVDGTRLYDVLMEETDPRLVFFQLDIFWAYVGATGAPAVATPSGPGRLRRPGPRETTPSSQRPSEATSISPACASGTSATETPRVEGSSGATLRRRSEQL